MCLQMMSWSSWRIESRMKSQSLLKPQGQVVREGLERGVGAFVDGTKILCCTFQPSMEPVRDVRSKKGFHSNALT